MALHEETTSYTYQSCQITNSAELWCSIIYVLHFHHFQFKNLEKLFPCKFNHHPAMFTEFILITQCRHYVYID